MKFFKQFPTPETSALAQGNYEMKRTVEEWTLMTQSKGGYYFPKAFFDVLCDVFRDAMAEERYESLTQAAEMVRDCSESVQAILQLRDEVKT